MILLLIERSKTSEFTSSFLDEDDVNDSLACIPVVEVLVSSIEDNTTARATIPRRM